MPVPSLRLVGRSIAGLSVGALLLAACGDDGSTSSAGAEPATTATTATDDMTEDMTDETPGDVLAVAAAEPDLGTFLAALEAAGIMEDFHGEGPFTIFAPSDAAFADYVASSGMAEADVLGDAAMLTTILSNHVVTGDDPSEMVMQMDGQSFTTLAGTSLDVVVDGETVRVGGAVIERYDLRASNGVIHVIDTVLGTSAP